MTKQRKVLVTALLLLALLVPGVAAQAANPGPTSVAAANVIQAASFTLDGVNLQVSSAALPSVSFSAAQPGNLNQVAVATSQHPYREFSIEAVPYNARPGVEAMPTAQAGGAADYLAALRKYREAQGGKVESGPAANIFGTQVTGQVSRVNLNLISATPVPTLIVEWVTEAGSRIWIVRSAQAIDSEDGGVPSLNSPSDITISSNNLNAPTTVTAYRQPVDKPATQQPPASPNSLPFPSWWNGNCDYYNYYYGSGGWNSYALGGSYNGLVACGPRPIYGGPDVLTHFFSGSWGAYEWECVELSLRYLYLAYNVAPYSANGSGVVWNYSGSALHKISNGTANAAPQAGDVLSYGATTSAGHTSVVSSSSVNSAGNGSITVVEQNNSANGVSTLTVSGWWVYGNAGAVSGWLHGGSGGGNTCPGTGCNGQDPVAMGCANDAYTARTTQGTIGSKSYTIELRWSPHCQSNWAKISVNQASTLEVQLEHTNGTAISGTYFGIGGSTAAYGNMYYAPTESVMACGKVDGYGWICTAGG